MLLGRSSISAAEASHCTRQSCVRLPSTAAGGSSENAAPSAAANRAAAPIWTSLDSFEATRKENERVPSRWAGVRLPQARNAAATGPAPEPLDIPVDDELAAAPTPVKGAAAPQVSPASVLQGLPHELLGYHAAPN